MGGRETERKSYIIKIRKKEKTHGVRSLREQVGFQESAERHQGVCFPGCLW